MATGVQVWSGTPVTNATADSNINWAEGMAPSQVNDSARSLMASVAKWRDDNNGSLLTSGTSLAYTVVTNQVEAANTSGYTLKVTFHAPNGPGATLGADGLVGAPMQEVLGTNVTSGVFQQGSIWCFTYSSTGTGQWLAHGGAIDNRDTVSPLFTVATKTTTADINLTGGTSVDGPSVSQGSSGVWYVVASATVTSASGANVFYKIWDGTSVVISGGSFVAPTNPVQFSLSGVSSSPAGNLKLTLLSSGALSILRFNQSGNSADTSLTAIRIG